MGAAGDGNDSMPTGRVIGSGPSRRLYSVPLVVAVTGHRDLLPDEIPAIRQRVRAFLEGLRSQSPDRDILLMSPLAEGADRLAAVLDDEGALADGRRGEHAAAVDGGVAYAVRPGRSFRAHGFDAMNRWRR